MPELPTSNREKFQTRNPVVRAMIGRFFGEVGATLAGEAPASLLDAGCGEGETLVRLGLAESIGWCHGVDLRAASLRLAMERCPGASFSRQSVTRLALPDGAVEMTICLEVLEHLADPGAALAELRRVTRRCLLLSVPHEPWFRLGSLARGKYLRTMGNHPEHVNHWNPRTFRAFLATSGLRNVAIRTAFPWILATCRLDGAAA